MNSSNALRLGWFIVLVIVLAGAPAQGAELEQRHVIVSRGMIHAGTSISRRQVKNVRAAAVEEPAGDFFEAIGEVVGGISLVDVPAHRAIRRELFWRPLPNLVDVGVLRFPGGGSVERPTGRRCGRSLDDWTEIKSVVESRLGKRLCLSLEPKDLNLRSLTVMGILVGASEDLAFVEMALRRSAVIEMSRRWSDAECGLDIAGSDGGFHAILSFSKPDDCADYPGPRRAQEESFRCRDFEYELSPERFMKYFFSVPWFGRVSTWSAVSDFDFLEP